MQRLLALRILLIIVCVSHIVLGLIANIFGTESVAQTIAQTYGATVEITPQLQHVVRILGAFMIAIGVLAAFALIDPQRNRAILNGIVILLLLRVLQRLVFATEIQEAFGISTGRLWSQSIFFFALAMAIFFLRSKASTYQNIIDRKRGNESSE